MEKVEWLEQIVIEYVKKNPGCGSLQVTNALEKYIQWHRTGGKRNWFIFYMAKLARNGKIKRDYGRDGRGTVTYFVK